jgi:putative ABC transport system permease protein
MNMDAKIFLPISSKADFSLGFIDEFSWDFSGITYIKTTETATTGKTAAVLQAIIDRDAPPAVSETSKIVLKPLADYYQLTNHGSVRNLIVSMSWIVAFILFMAIANFVNITISSSFTRLKEIGVRKAIGGIRQQVMTQCMFESTVYACIAGLLGLLTYELLHSYFGVMLSTELPSIFMFSVRFWLVIASGIFLIGLLAGAYPAFYLSAARTIESLKGKFKSVSGTILFSRSLVGLQFGISIFILASAVIISLQIDYFLSKDLGYDRTSVYVVTSAPRLWSAEGLARIEVAKRELVACPAVQAVSLSIGSPAVQLGMNSVDVRRVGQSVEEAVNADFTASDEDYADVYGLTIVEGRYFTDENGSLIPLGVVINESSQKALSMRVGDKIHLGDLDVQEHTVVGVVKDFNFTTFHDAVRPVVIAHTRDALVFRFYSFKVAPGNLPASIQEIERAWRRAFPNDAFMGSFADERVEQQYKTEMSLRKASAIGSVLMMIIVLTGVLGLVALTVAKRNKEIGIRKVLGASTIHLLNLLAREYVLVMLLAFAAGLPLSYWFVTNWLSTFVYHIDLSWWMFFIPSVAVFGLTILVVAARGLGAALANPVKSLRYE